MRTKQRTGLKLHDGWYLFLFTGSCNNASTNSWLASRKALDSMLNRN